MPSKKQFQFLIINKETISARIEKEKAKEGLEAKAKIKQAQTQVIKDETSHSNLGVSQELKPRYEEIKDSTDNEEVSESRDNKHIVADLSSMLPKEIIEDDEEDEVLQFSSLLEKHEEINETGLLKNVEQKTKYLLPNIIQGNSPKVGSK